MRETIAAVRAFFADGAANTEPTHWVEGHISSPMSVYPEFRGHRASFGLRRIGEMIVEVESSSGRVGWGTTNIAGEPAAWVVEHLLAPLVVGADVRDVERIAGVMRRGTLHFGRKGIVCHAISAVDLAVWDLLGRIRDEPVWAMIGGAVRDGIDLYCTGPWPEAVAPLGFIGGKIPLEYSPAEGASGLRANVQRLADARAKVPDDYWLAWDAWMSLDVDYAARLVHAAADVGLHWLEEPLPPDDYLGMAELKRRTPPGVRIATGEHEYGVDGFRLLLELACCDVLQPDVAWLGGLTEALKVVALAEANRIECVMHGPHVSHLHLAAVRHNVPYAEFLVPAATAGEITPDFGGRLQPWLTPRNGRLDLPPGPGFGLTYDTSRMRRPA